MHFGPSRDGLCLSFIGNVDVCPFSLSRSPRRSRFVSLILSSLLFFIVLLVFRSLFLSLSLSLSLSPRFLYQVYLVLLDFAPPLR